MDYLVKETQNLLQLSSADFADLFGISYSEMSDIIEGKKNPSNKLIRGCEIAKHIFLRTGDT